MNELQQVAMNDLITRANRTLGQHGAASICIGNESSCFLDHDDPSRNIPGLQISLPETIIVSRGDETEIKGRGTKAANIADLRHDGGKLGHELGMLLSLADMRNSAAD